MHLVLDYFIYMQFKSRVFAEYFLKSSKPIVMPVFPSLLFLTILGSFDKDHLTFCCEFN